MYTIPVSNEVQRAKQAKVQKMKDSQTQVNALIKPLTPITVNLPFIHPKLFAPLVGVTQDTITAWIDRGYIPTTKVGRYRMINLVQVQHNLSTTGTVNGGAA